MRPLFPGRVGGSSMSYRRHWNPESTTHAVGGARYGERHDMRAASIERNVHRAGCAVHRRRVASIAVRRRHLPSNGTRVTRTSGALAVRAIKRRALADPRLPDWRAADAADL